MISRLMHTGVQCAAFGTSPLFLKPGDTPAGVQGGLVSVVLRLLGRLAKQAGGNAQREAAAGMSFAVSGNASAPAGVCLLPRFAPAGRGASRPALAAVWASVAVAEASL